MATYEKAPNTREMRKRLGLEAELAPRAAAATPDDSDSAGSESDDSDSDRIHSEDSGTDTSDDDDVMSTPARRPVPRVPDGPAPANPLDLGAGEGPARQPSLDRPVREITGLDGEALHAALLTVRMTDHYPLSGAARGVPLLREENFTIDGFKSASPPESVRIEYHVLGEPHTGTAEADSSVTPVERKLTFRSTMLVGSERVDRICADFTVRFDRQYYYVTRANHVELQVYPIHSAKRFANLTLVLDAKRKQLADDRVSLDLSVDLLPRLLYRVHWTCTGVLMSAAGDRPWTVGGKIMITNGGELRAMDTPTEKYFGLPPVA
ncbi:hypothetical protein [Actinokineospora sp.]|uniref:hypothetical protein n=1 Tax=Actinokineospora sp. TaxID=1872133 RepID=UPI004037838B